MPNIRRMVLFTAALLFGLGGPATARPGRIVSLNLCADQILMAIADKGQIAALGPFARDPALSFYWREAKAYPITKGSSEAVLALRPDLILAPPYQQKDTFGVLQRQGTRIVDLPFADSLEMIFANIRTVAEVTGHQARGEALIRRMQARLEALGQDKPGRGRVAAYYQRRGYLTGTGTLTDEIMARVGLINLAGKLGKPSLSRLSLEEIMAARPDFLLMDSDTSRVEDQGTAMLHHPALTRSIPLSRQIYLPQSLTVCGGPFYPEAVGVLRDRIRKADGQTTSSGR